MRYKFTYSTPCPPPRIIEERVADHVALPGVIALAQSMERDGDELQEIQDGTGRRVWPK